MNEYINRSVNFFFKSIKTLKKESGGQRWNEICEDTVLLLEYLYPKKLGYLSLSHSELWEIFFEPPQGENDPLYLRFKNLYQTETSVDYLIILLQALLDPPASWWKSQYEK